MDTDRLTLASTGWPNYISDTVPDCDFNIGDTINLFGKFDRSCEVFIGNKYCNTTFVNAAQVRIAYICLKRFENSCPQICPQSPTNLPRVAHSCQRDLPTVAYRELPTDLPTVAHSCLQRFAHRHLPTSSILSLYPFFNGRKQKLLSI